jgi:uncharacterized protein YkwD
MNENRWSQPVTGSRRALAVAIGGLIVALSAVDTSAATVSTVKRSTGAVSIGKGASAAGGSVGLAVARFDRTPIGDKMERHVLRRVNTVRRAHDLQPLRARACPDRYAERWTRHMARQQDFQHQSLDGLLRDCAEVAAGENIAVGYPTSKAVTRAWMHSSGHRANILNPNYRWIGIGAYRAHHRWWWTQDFVG